MLPSLNETDIHDFFLPSLTTGIAVGRNMRGTQKGSEVLDFYEFFAGGGMARAGLGKRWNCLLANDFSAMKAHAYRLNWGDSDLIVGDVGLLQVGDLPGRADLAWASFPCQDLSLAGNYAGIGREHDNERTRSGTFWSFWKLMLDLKRAVAPLG